LTVFKELRAEEVDVMDSVNWIGCQGKWELDFKRKGHGARKCMCKESVNWVS